MQKLRKGINNAKVNYVPAIFMVKQPACTVPNSWTLVFFVRSRWRGWLKRNDVPKEWLEFVHHLALICTARFHMKLNFHHLISSETYYAPRHFAVGLLAICVVPAVPHVWVHRVGTMEKLLV